MFMLLNAASRLLVIDFSRLGGELKRSCWNFSFDVVERQIGIINQLNC